MLKWKRIPSIILTTSRHLFDANKQSDGSWQKIKFIRKFHTCNKCLGVFEPDDVGLGPEIPEYEELNVSIKGYDYVHVEAFAKYIHNTAKQLGISSESWASPSQTSEVHLYKANTSITESKYDLIKSERVVQLQDLPSTMLPVMVEIMREQAPEGVEVMLKESDPEEEENRYIPEKDLMEVQEKLKEMKEERVGRRKKKT